MTYHLSHAPLASDAPVADFPGHRRGSVWLRNQALIAALPQPPLLRIAHGFFGRPVASDGLASLAAGLAGPFLCGTLGPLLKLASRSRLI